MSGRALALGLGVLLAVAAPAAAQTTETLVLRGRPLTLHLYGPGGGEPTVVASGDGGWVHLGPEVAEMLAAQGRFVVGLDSKEYLAHFTSSADMLMPRDVPGDFAALMARARHGRSSRVLLAGVSEGAALAVLAAADAALQPQVVGVLGLGLPDEAELGWRWRDALIWLTRKTPDEPVFHTSAYVARLGSIPLAALHSTNDEFVPLAEVERVMSVPGGVKRLWVIPARNHRFSGATEEFNQKLQEALQWIAESRAN
jgi:fermentation-respiration switch protein FrsA (DUF1100 family)